MEEQAIAREHMLGQFLSPSAFRLPERLVGSAWHGHAPFAAWLIEGQRPQSLVELGTHAGFSYLCFCEAVRTAGLRTQCTAVDTWRGDEHAGFYDESIFADLERYHSVRYSAFSRLLRMTFDEAADHVPDGSVDLLHIDGRHRYEDVSADFESWRPKLSDRAIVLFHDTTVRERDFGVHQFWSEVSAQRPHFEFLHGHGLGVLGIGSALPARTVALFEANDNPHRRAVIRACYQRLGMAVIDRWEKTVAEQRLVDAHRIAAEANQRAVMQTAEADQLRKTLAAQLLGSMKRPTA